MEKKGYSLRGLAPIPFLLMLLRNAEVHASAAAPSAEPIAAICEAVSSGTVSAVSTGSSVAVSASETASSTTAISSASSTASPASAGTSASSVAGIGVKGAAGKVALSLQAKILAGAIAAASVAGVGYATLNALTSQTQTSSSQPAASPEEKTDLLESSDFSQDEDVVATTNQDNQIDLTDQINNSDEEEPTEVKIFSWDDVSNVQQENIIEGAKDAMMVLRWEQWYKYLDDATYSIVPYAIYIECNDYHTVKADDYIFSYVEQRGMEGYDTYFHGYYDLTDSYNYNVFIVFQCELSANKSEGGSHIDIVYYDGVFAKAYESNGNLEIMYLKNGDPTDDGDITVYGFNWEYYYYSNGYWDSTIESDKIISFRLGKSWIGTDNFRAFAPCYTFDDFIYRGQYRYCILEADDSKYVSSEITYLEDMSEIIVSNVE